MKKKKNEYMSTATHQICDLLKEAADRSDPDHTVWMDVDFLATVTLGAARPGTRRAVRSILKYLRRRGQVEQRVFGDLDGWRWIR